MTPLVLAVIVALVAPNVDGGFCVTSERAWNVTNCDFCDDNFVAMPAAYTFDSFEAAFSVEYTDLVTIPLPGVSNDDAADECRAACLAATSCVAYTLPQLGPSPVCRNLIREYGQRQRTYTDTQCQRRLFQAQIHLTCAGYSDVDYQSLVFSLPSGVRVTELRLDGVRSGFEQNDGTSQRISLGQFSRPSSLVLTVDGEIHGVAPAISVVATTAIPRENESRDENVFTRGLIAAIVAGVLLLFGMLVWTIRSH